MERTRQRGFTLIEAMVVLSVLAVIVAMAAPSMRDFMVRNKVASLSNEFSAALMQTRALAVAKNTCATLCASTTITGSSTTATCSNGASDDFQKGWIIFVNSTCTSAAAGPAASTDVVVLRRGETAGGYGITPSAAALSNVMFDPRGLAVLAASGNFAVSPPTTADDEFKRTICLDSAGRATVRRTKSSGTCS